MKIKEKAAFVEFVFDEATKYGRAITTPEVETYFENLTRPTFDEVKNAWIEHRRGERGHLFPKIVDLQRLLRLAGEGAKSRDDPRCKWVAGTMRCRYPVGWFEQGKREGYCVFHRVTPTGPDAQDICDQSQGMAPEDFAKQLHTYANRGGDSPAAAVVRAQMQAVKNAPRCGLFAQVILPPRSTGPEADAADAHIAEADAAHYARINALAQQAALDDAGVH